MNLRLVIEYDGEGFSGWQRQENASSIQGELEGALRIFLESEYKKQGVKLPSEDYLSQLFVNGSGRTDAGVHALEQNANVILGDDVSIDLVRLKAALNGITPRSIVVRYVSQVSKEFDARLSAHVKCYCYRFCLRQEFTGILSQRAWCVGNKLDIKNMILAARKFCGTHNFRSFRAADCTAPSTVRTIVSSELVRTDSDMLEFRVCGKGFLKQMVRIMAGTLIDVGRDRISYHNIEDLLETDDRIGAGETAPAYALTLEWMEYTPRT